MNFVGKVKMLGRCSQIAGVACFVPLLGWFLYPENQRFYSAGLLVCMLVAIVSHIVKKHWLVNASSANRKAGKQAGIYR